MTDIQPVEALDNTLILAAEECPPEEFGNIHTFAALDDSLIRKLMAHGPVLIRGGRGSGKSALLIEAYRRSRTVKSVFAVYVSLRYLPLLQSEGAEYIAHFCLLLSQKVRDELVSQGIDADFEDSNDQATLQIELGKLAQSIGRRIVLLFDDAAHIGREKPLEVFFDLFRTLSTSVTSCKASIYPGVTRFGVRFDVFNDATVVDVSRLDAARLGGTFFLDVLRARYPDLASAERFSDRISVNEFANFIGRSVVGNMRGFVLACLRFENQPKIGVPEINSCILAMAQDYYWPLMEEVSPKLGIYEPLVEPAREAMEVIVDLACRQARGERPTTASDRILVHRNIVSQYAKVFEILEYLGFIYKREASRALKSGGRGPVYAINLCNLIDQMPQQRLTLEIMNEWLEGNSEPAQMHVSGQALSTIVLPPIPDEHGLTIFDKPIAILAQSGAYPYGLTDDKIARLTNAGYETVGALASAQDAELLKLDRVGEATVRRIRNVLYQAIWM
ncbi:MAG: ATP-binding protein [Alphaproteobacteria bacterium]|nr:MAG: ATP-binding protein [Alphaproteobacteria bacterium]